MEPASRASAWRKGFNVAHENSDAKKDCGGVKYLKKAAGKCGICGDPWFMQPRKLEPPGMFATGIRTRTYLENQTINVTIEMTKMEGGSFIFRLCANNNIKKDPDQKCFDKCCSFYLI